MRFRLFTLLLLTIITAFSQYAIAQEVTIKRSTIVENFKGKPYYIHFVGKGETLSQLAEVYNISIQELIAENPTVEKGLKADMVLRIPQKPIVSTAIVEVPNPVAKNQQPIPAENPKVQTKPAEKQTEPAKPFEKSTLPGKPAVNQDYIAYTVKKHETLYGIAKVFNITVDDILNANPGFQKLDEGMEIRIPQKKAVNAKSVPNETVTVKSLKQDDSIPYEIIIKPGETLLSISKKYNISIHDMTELNPKLSDGLKTGMVLKLSKPDSKNTLKPALINDEVSVAGPVSTVRFYSADNMKVTYNIALLLPFLLDNSQDAIDAAEQKKASDFENFNYFQFYEGFLLAADSLQQYGLHARIQVLDGDKLNDTLTIRQTLR